MAKRDEVDSPTTDNDATPLPGERGTVPDSVPTPAVVLGWIGAAGGKPWFPSQHAGDTPTARDALDLPLNVLRIAELIRIADWVRGVGQGYILTPEGETALRTGTGIPGPAAVLTGSGPPAIPEDPPIRLFSSTALELRPIVVPILIAANVLWFFVGIVIVQRTGQPLDQYLSGGNGQVLHQLGAVTGHDLLRGEWWRLLTSAFVHIGIIHLLINMVALGMVGPRVEQYWGRGRFAVIYFFSAIGGSCLAMALEPNALLAGASGAIWGLFTALIAGFILFWSEGLPVRPGWLVSILVFNIAVSFLPHISWQGHLGGGLAGFATAWLLHAMWSGDTLRRVLAFLLLLAVPVASVGGVLYAMKHGEAWAGQRHRAALEEQLRNHVNAASVFDREVAPLLDALAPEPIKSVEDQARFQLLRPGARRNADRVAEARAKLTEWKATADMAVSRLAVPPTGMAAIDQHRERARAFAEARSKQLALVLAMLDSPAAPDDRTWAEWVAARNQANALWLPLRRR